MSAAERWTSLSRKDTKVLDQAVAIFMANPNSRLKPRPHRQHGFVGIQPETLGSPRQGRARLFIKQGIAPERIRAQGFGETRSMASNDTAEGRALNRRVELHPHMN